MSFTNAAFRKVTGVDLTADTPALEKGLATAVKRSTQAEIATALLVRELVARGWKVQESAEKVGISQSNATLAGNRGAILWETGPDQIEIVWANVRALPANALTPLGDTLRAMTNNADRVEYVIRLGQRTIATKRLGANATPERIEAMTDAMVADGHRTPVTGRKAVAGIAERLSIPLPVAARPGTPNNKASDKADVPTFDAAMAAALVAIEQAYAGADADNPVMLTPEQSKLADDVMAALARLIDVAKVAIPA